MAKRKALALDGTAWSMTFDDAEPGCADLNRLSFARGVFTSADCVKEGFRPSRYRMVPGKGAGTAWQAFQTNGNGVFNSWKVVLRGKVMKGTLTSSDTNTAESDTYAFTAVDASK